MKKLIFIFLITLCGCSGIINPVQTRGKIVEIAEAGGGNIYIRVQFSGAINHESTYYEWFTASDTCRVGQIVNLK